MHEFHHVIHRHEGDDGFVGGGQGHARRLLVGRSNTVRPKAEAARSTIRWAVFPRSSRKGFSSTRSSELIRPDSWIISITRCASRTVAPPGTVVPTPGAGAGSMK